MKKWAWDILAFFFILLTIVSLSLAVRSMGSKPHWSENNE